MELDPNRDCQECDRSFGMPGLLSKHLLVLHGEEETLVCEECEIGGSSSQQFKRKMNFIIHYRSQAHREHKLLGCDICDAFLITNGFEDEEALEQHTKDIHGEDVTVNPKDRQCDFACPFCGSTFTHRKGMIEHVQVIHVEHLYRHCLQEKDENLELLMGNVRFSCKDCKGAQFRVKSTLNRHREKFHKDYSHWEKVQNRGNLPPEAIEAIRKAKASPTPSTPSPGMSKRLSLPSSAKSLATDGPKSSLTPAAAAVAAASSLKSKTGTTTSSILSPPKKLHAIFDKTSWKKSPYLSPAKTSSFSGQSSSSYSSSFLSKISPFKAAATASTTTTTTTTVAKCKFCGKCFTRPSVLTVHLEMVHRSEMASAKKGTIVGVKTVVASSSSSAAAAATTEGIKKRFSLPLKLSSKTNGFASKPTLAPVKRVESVGTHPIRTIAKLPATVPTKTEEMRDHFRSDNNKTTITDEDLVAGSTKDATGGSGARKCVRDRKRSLSDDDEAEKPGIKESKLLYPKGEQFPDYVHKTFDPARQVEDCMVKSCPLKFISYFSMMRHVAFKHYPDKTARLMKVEPVEEWDLSGTGRDDLDQEEVVATTLVTKKKKGKKSKAAAKKRALIKKRQTRREGKKEEEEKEFEKKSGHKSVKKEPELARPQEREEEKEDESSDQMNQEHQVTDEFVDEIEMTGIPEDEFA